MKDGEDQEDRVVAQDAGDFDDIVTEQLMAKPWAELEAIEYADRLLFPDKIYRRKKDGTFEGVPVMLRVPRNDELRKARVKAHAEAQRSGIDPRRDASVFDDLENVIIMADFSVRSPTPPYEPLEMDYEQLEKRFDRDALSQAWSKIDAYRRVVDPRSSNMTEQQALQLVAAIAEGRRTDPLAAFDGPAQHSYIIFTASLLHRLLRSSSSSLPSESSTRGPSSSQTSSGSSGVEATRT